MTVLVERESCLAAIRSRLAEVAAGTGHLLLLCGEAGVDARLEMTVVLEERGAEDDRDRQVEERAEQRRRLGPGLEQRLAVDHLDRRPDEDRGTDVAHAREAIDDLEHDRAAPDDDRHAEDQAGMTMM